MTDLITDIRIDAGAKVLRERLQASKRLNEWASLPNSVKRKWRDHAAAIIAAADGAALPMLVRAEWQPIETAPKDGTRILIAGGTYYYDASEMPDQEFTSADTAYWRNGGWCGGYGSEYNGEYWHKPTHWQPLPAPPATAIRSRGEP